MRKLAGALIVFAFALLLVFPQLVRSAEPSASPVPSLNSEFSSYEIFWPLVAGKTVEDSIYPLKTFKESVREFLIFGKAQKAEYQVFLSTKRLLEAEALLNAGKKDLAEKTLDASIAKLDQALLNLEDAKKASAIPQGIVNEINNRVANMKILTAHLIATYDSSQAKLQNVLDRLTTLSSRI